jgi:hypothetical protein
MGLSTLALARWRPRRAVDPIEANALYGGRMSMNGSLIVVLQTIMSNGVGASVGLEAGYTQIGSAIASRGGHAFRVRRNDLRLLVGCGAAAAIAGAFNAPLTGSFYAFELVIGTYTLTTLVPVVLAAVFATLVSRELFGEQPIFVVYSHVDLFATNYLILAAVGFCAGLLAIAAMVGVTFVEQWTKRASLPTWARPAMGGLVLGQEVARQLKCRFIFVEKEEGRLALRRGFKINPNERVLIGEDVVTKGGRVQETIDIVVGRKGNVVGVAMAVDRSNGAFILPVPMEIADPAIFAAIRPRSSGSS